MADIKKVLALGFFDSIHIGHRYLINEAKKLSEKLDAELYVTTFGDDFLKYIGKEDKEIYLLEERKTILAGLDVKNVMVFPTTKEFLSKSKEDFLTYISNLSIIGLVVGLDYSFGENASGTVFDLKEYFDKQGTEISVCKFVTDKGEKVSSTRIKQLLLNGDISEANKLLGSEFFYSGKKVSGRHDGSKIGVPTINIDIPNKKIRIKTGVYATKTVINGKEYISVTNVGTHPTFNDDNFNTETHIINGVPENYDGEIKIKFIEYIREIRFFDEKQKLAEQIGKDIEYTLGVMKNDKIRSCGE